MEERDTRRCFDAIINMPFLLRNEYTCPFIVTRVLNPHE